MTLASVYKCESAQEGHAYTARGGVARPVGTGLNIEAVWLGVEVSGYAPRSDIEMIVGFDSCVFNASAGLES